MQLSSCPIFQLKASGQGIVQGLAASFGGLDSYGDSVAPGAFAASLAAHKAAGTMPAMLWSHRMAEPVGKWVHILEGPRGLAVEGQLNLRTERGAQAFEHLREGDLNGLSIGYSVGPGGEEIRADGVRVLKQIVLHEVSVVTIPADAGARISSVKTEGELPQSVREFERWLHRCGFSKTRATVIARHGFKVDPHWQADDDPEPSDDLDPEKLAALAAQFASFTIALKGTQ
jgi:HK97 family phage prohead protease